jgi:hypothetical protein
VVDQVGQDFGVGGEELFEDVVVFGTEKGFHGEVRIAWGAALGPSFPDIGTNGGIPGIFVF